MQRIPPRKETGLNMKSNVCDIERIGAVERSWPASISLAGACVHPLGMTELNNLLEQRVANGSTSIIANHNLHSLCLYHQDAKVREFYAEADCAHVDGMGVVFLAKLLGKKIDREQRVTYVDWVPSLMEIAVRHGWRVFYLGSKPGVAFEAAERLRRTYSGLVIDTAHGFFDVNPEGAENQAILERIRAFNPNVLMVGMGMPRQEYWILDNVQHLHSMAVLTSGAAFDYFAGVVPTPPRWAGRIGLEWLASSNC